MSDMKCPICGNDLEHYHTGLVCYRHCLNDKNVWGSEETLKELDRTRKALDIAIERLEFIAQETFQGEPSSINMGFHVRAAAALTDIEQITENQ